MVAGIVAMTYPLVSMVASTKPMASSSCNNNVDKSFCFSVEGKLRLFGSLCVSICTYRISLSATPNAFHSIDYILLCEGIKKGIPNQWNAFFKKSLTYY